MSKSTLLYTFLLSCLLWSCAEVQEPEFRRLERFGVRGIGPTSAKLGFSITYYNPNGYGVTVKESAVDVYIDSVYIGQLRQDSVTTVRARSEFSVPLSGDVTLSTIRQLNLPQLALSEVPVRAQGTTRIGKGGVFVTRDISYTGRHRLQVRL